MEAHHMLEMYRYEYVLFGSTKQLQCTWKRELICSLNCLEFIAYVNNYFLAREMLSASLFPGNYSEWTSSYLLLWRLGPWNYLDIWGPRDLVEGWIL